MNKAERFVNQATSGRWLLTVIAGLCLLAMTLADCWAVTHGKEPPISVEAIFSIITMVFGLYFSRAKEGTNRGGDATPAILSKPPAPPAPPVP